MELEDSASCDGSNWTSNTSEHFIKDVKPFNNVFDTDITMGIHNDKRIKDSPDSDSAQNGNVTCSPISGEHNNAIESAKESLDFRKEQLLQSPQAEMDIIDSCQDSTDHLHQNQSSETLEEVTQIPSHNSSTVARSGNSDLCMEYQDERSEHDKHQSKDGRVNFFCDECGEEQEDCDSLSLHHRKSHGKSVFVCDLCAGQFRNTSSLYIHAKHAHGVLKTLKCVCNKIFENIKKIKAHYQVCKMYQLVCLPQTHEYSQCSQCGEQFHTESQYNRHMSMHWSQEEKTRSHICETCGKGFYTKRILMNHMKNIHNPSKLKCPFCEKILKTINGMLYHVFQHDVKGNNENVKYKCCCCDYVTSEAESMKQHILTKHKSKGKPKNKSSEQDDSQNEEDDENKVEGYVKADLTCEICGRVSANKGAMLDHLALHSGEVTVVCKVCDRGFVTRHAYRKHMRQNHGVFSGPRRGVSASLHVDCEVCGLTLCRNALQKHMDIHNGVFRFKCKICDKACRSKYDLVVHSRVHTGEKPFKCDVCNRVFSDQANLRHHQKRIHALVQPKIEYVRKTGFHKRFTKEEQEAVRKWEEKNGQLTVNMPVDDSDLLIQISKGVDVTAVDITSTELEFVKTAVENVFQQQQQQEGQKQGNQELSVKINKCETSPKLEPSMLELKQLQQDTLQPEQQQKQQSQQQESQPLISDQESSEKNNMKLCEINPPQENYENTEILFRFVQKPVDTVENGSVGDIGVTL